MGNAIRKDIAAAICPIGVVVALIVAAAVAIAMLVVSLARTATEIARIGLNKANAKQTALI
jgi:hypothetical protein